MAPGRFGRERFDALAATSGGPGREVEVGGAMFACHKSPEGAEEACAGWLAVAGVEHLGVRPGPTSRATGTFQCLVASFDPLSMPA
ncbi:hypothetical protein [Rhodococcus koreensis]|uniref:hypothetical protein n=1 Tax=Rhodococcus koreensis TaxID=99653 RepID=UPI001F12733C|nr:hypothetical protein [Rhodococcus koreensis]